MSLNSWTLLSIVDDMRVVVQMIFHREMKAEPSTEGFLVDGEYLIRSAQGALVIDQMVDPQFEGDPGDVQEIFRGNSATELVAFLAGFIAVAEARNIAENEALARDLAPKES